MKQPSGKRNAEVEAMKAAFIARNGVTKCAPGGRVEEPAAKLRPIAAIPERAAPIAVPSPAPQPAPEAPAAPAAPTPDPAPHEPSLRPVRPLPLPGVTPAADVSRRLECEWVNPTDLHVEDRYQRSLGEKSIRLIRRIVADWDWARMKPPICARGADGRLFVVDGQHTAIAAASHPGIDAIPVMVIQVDTVEQRASAFIGHNRDRVAMTPMQIHYASLAAGDEIAVAMDEACRRAGCVIRRSMPVNCEYDAGDTVAIGALQGVVKAKGVAGAARLLGLLKDANRAPIGAQEIKAVFALLYEPEWAGTFEDRDLATVIRSKSAEGWSGYAEATVRKGLKMPLWRAVAIAWFKAVPKRRKAT